MAPRILIFSIVMGADYSFELIFIETYAPQFIGHNKIFLGSVLSNLFNTQVFVLRFDLRSDRVKKYEMDWLSCNFVHRNQKWLGIEIVVIGLPSLSKRVWQSQVKYYPFPFPIFLNSC